MYLEIFVLNLQFGPVGETGFILKGVYIGFTSMIYNLSFTNKKTFRDINKHICYNVQLAVFTFLGYPLVV